MPLVHNISSPPRAITIGGTKIWPGDHAVVSDDALADPMVQPLLGTCLFEGRLAARETTKKRSPMTEKELRKHLAHAPSDFLEKLRTAVTPNIPPRASRPRLEAQLVRASRDKEGLNPEIWWFTGWWEQPAEDTYVLIEE